MEHPFFTQFEWEKMRVGEMASPLQAFAQDQRTQRTADGPGDELFNCAINEPEHESWLKLF